MKITRLCAGAVVAGAFTFGAIAPASAGSGLNLNTAPALKIGQGYYTERAQVDLLPTPATNPPIVVPLGIVNVQVLGESYFGPQDGDLGNFLANPLPVNVCALCHPENNDEAT